MKVKHYRDLYSLCNIMIPGAKGHIFHVYMKKYDFETRKNMRKQPEQGEFRMFLGFREHKVRRNPVII